MPTPTDPYTATDGAPIIAAETNARFGALYTELNGGVDGDNFTAAARDLLGLTDASAARSGFFARASEDTLDSRAYAVLPTPDRVSVKVPANGVVFALYQAQWKCDTAAAATAAFFVGGQQLHIASFGGPGFGAQVQEATSPNGTLFAPLGSFWGGVLSDTAAPSINYGGDVLPMAFGAFLSAGLFLGGPMVCQASPGTVAVEVRFKSTSGIVHAKNRTLAVWTRGT